jgi:outer membrane protein assembly factor BamB
LQAHSEFYSTPAIEGDVLYACALDGIFYALDAKTGMVLWQTSVDTPGAKIWSSPAVVHGQVIVGTASTLSEHPKIAGQILALDAKTGKLRWRTWTEAHAAPGGGIWSSPAIDVDQGIVYAATGDPDDGAEALSLQDGHRIWHWRSLAHDTADTDIGAGPTLYQDQQGLKRIVIGGKNGDIYSLDAKNGNVLWQTHVGDQVYSSPTFANGMLYVVGVHGHSAISWALSALTGAPSWQHVISTIVYASPAIAGQTLYLSIGDGFVAGAGGIEVVDASNGQLLQYVNIQSTTSSSPAVLPSWVFIGAHSGNLYAFMRQKS